MTIVDYPIFKVLGAAVTILVLFLLFKLTFAGTADTVMIMFWPCVMVLIWAGIKRRSFWMYWLIAVAAAGVGLAIFGDGGTFTMLIGYGYWLVSAAVCLMQIFSRSLEQKHYEEEWKAQMERDRAYDAVMKHSESRCDEDLNALLDSLGKQIPKDRE